MARNSQEEPQFKLENVVVPTFEVWSKETGEKMVVDVRTFDEELHSKTPPAKKGKDKD